MEGPCRRSTLTVNAPHGAERADASVSRGSLEEISSPSARVSDVEFSPAASVAKPAVPQTASDPSPLAREPLILVLEGAAQGA